MTRNDIAKVYHQNFLDLLYSAATIHRENHDSHIMRAELLSVKTGGCPEDCSYCPQSAHYKTGVMSEKLLTPDTVLEYARNAKQNGADRFCMGAAWRNMKEGDEFEAVLKMVKKVSELGMQTCCTMGMVTKEQAKKLKQAGLYAYNHNLDTGRDYYKEIIHTREYQERLDTLQNLAEAGISLCCGGIVGMGETDNDRIEFLHELTLLPVSPESIPVNQYVPVEGVPLSEKANGNIFSMVRVIATARILFPGSYIRLSAGRKQMSYAEQTLCFMAGANSVFTGDKLLTQNNATATSDNELFSLLGVTQSPGTAHSLS